MRRAVFERRNPAPASPGKPSPRGWALRRHPAADTKHLHWASKPGANAVFGRPKRKSALPRDGESAGWLTPKNSRDAVRRDTRLPSLGLLRAEDNRHEDTCQSRGKGLRCTIARGRGAGGQNDEGKGSTCRHLMDASRACGKDQGLRPNGPCAHSCWLYDQVLDESRDSSSTGLCRVSPRLR